MSRKGNWRSLSQLRLIKSIQSYEITIASGANSATQALSPAVDRNHAYAYHNGTRLGGSASFAANTDECAVELTDNNTVTVMSDTAHATLSRIVSVQVVEYWPWAASVQHNNVNLNGIFSVSRSLNPAVDVNLSAFIHTGQTCSSTTQNQSRCAVRGVLAASGISVDLSRNSGSTSARVYYSVIEFAPGVVKSRQQQSVIFSGTVQTVDSTISAVDLNNSIVFWGGQENNAFQDDIVGCFLFDSTTLRFSGGRSVENDTRKGSATVIEFMPKHVTQAAQQCGDTIASGAATQNKTITAVTDSRTLVHRSGWWTSNNSSNNSYPTLFRTSTTNVRQQRGGTPAVTVDTKGIAIGLRL